ncbi:MAG TPA: redox-regulated ATPase YchF [Erysipelotrichaceae bacterium]|nr:redox-regulated ATPase YchF [Erysipelotrichaceae bacterium]
MGLKAGIVGLPNVGKSTLFNAITNLHVEAANYPFATINPNTGVVNVPDERLTCLTNIFKPLRKIPASVEFIDIAGLVKGASHGEGLGNQFLAQIRECDAVVEVVRCFVDPDIFHIEDSIDPIRDIEIINLELVMADLNTVLKRIEKNEAKARIAKDKEAIYEMAILNPLKTTLEQGFPARKAKLSEEQIAYSKNNYHLLTSKPIIYVANVGEEDLLDLNSSEMYQQVVNYAIKDNSKVIPVSARVESDLSSLNEKEKQEYLKELNVDESGLEKVIKATYCLLDLSTFFTVGSDECRAWTFKNGMSAPECAGIVHTDFQKGFICAEVYPYEAIKELGSENAVREAGKIRTEGKNYYPKDGDIMFFRFNVNKRV